MKYCCTTRFHAQQLFCEKHMSSAVVCSYNTVGRTSFRVALREHGYGSMLLLRILQDGSR
jgi:hypothetical protein